MIRRPCHCGDPFAQKGDVLSKENGGFIRIDPVKTVKGTNIGGITAEIYGSGTFPPKCIGHAKTANVEIVCAFSGAQQQFPVIFFKHRFYSYRDTLYHMHGRRYLIQSIFQSENNVVVPIGIYVYDAGLCNIRQPGIDLYPKILQRHFKKTIVVIAKPQIVADLSDSVYRQLKSISLLWPDQLEIS